MVTSSLVMGAKYYGIDGEDDLLCDTDGMLSQAVMGCRVGQNAML